MVGQTRISSFCGLLVVTCSWFGFNAIIVLYTHLLELTFEFTCISIVKDNELRLWVLWNKSWMNVADLFVFLTISNQPVLHCWIYHCEWKQRVCFGWCPYCKWTHHIHIDHEPGIQCQILIFWLGEAHILCNSSPSLSFDILDKWNINNQCPTSCVRPGHVMIFLIVFSALIFKE
jgi:hypothetical protein